MKVSVIDSDWIRQHSYRLDASVYDPDVLTIARSVNEYSEQIRIGEVADVWMPGRFKRYRTEYPEHGVPFLTASQILLAEPSKSEYLSQKLHKKDLPRLLPNPGTILVTRSGTVGSCAIVTQSLSGFAVSEDAIRVETRERLFCGYLYTFLSGPLGRILLTRDKYGSVVDHIEPFHIQELAVPLLPEELVASIGKRVEAAWNNRELANNLLFKARIDLCDLLDLPTLSESQSPLASTGKAFYLQSSNLGLRLDASHYHPLGRKAVSILEKRPDCQPLGMVTKRIFHPFQMNMVLVEKKYGVPLYGGTDINHFRYFGDKYVSPVTENSEDYLLQRGWSLITRSGTIGRISYVGDYLEGNAGSSHLIRVVPDEKKILPGFLNAYLTSTYAQLQIESQIYGSVVDQIRESQLRAIRILVPDIETQKHIHNMVEEAYRLRYEANCQEDEAQELLTMALGLEA